MHKAPLRVDVSLQVEGFFSNGKWQESPLPMQGVCLDSRSLQEGDVFFALKGVRDGHDFVEDCLQKGASACVVSPEFANSHTGRLFAVDDPYKHLCFIASKLREQWGKKLIAISGSNGKTSTKEMSRGILSAYQKTHHSPGTWNNHLGVPLSLFSLRPEHAFSVLEMGMNHAGELTHLCKLAQPDIAILTNIGPAHLAEFGTIDGVFQAKRELFDTLKSSATAVINLDDQRIAQAKDSFLCKKVTVSALGAKEADVALSFQSTEGGVSLYRLRYGSHEQKIQTKMLGQHNASNLVCALGAAFALGMPASKLQSGIDTIAMPSMRLEQFSLQRNILLINDCYNANPASMQVALKVLGSLARKRKIAVLGDMLELGKAAAIKHQDMGRFAFELGYDALYLVGQYRDDLAQGAVAAGMDESKVACFASRDTLGAQLLSDINEGDSIVVKGSRAMKLESVVNMIRSNIGDS